MDDAQRRDMWASRTERCLSADTTIKEWCRLNKVSESNLYRRMARFREEEPGRFPRRSSKASDWIKVTAGGIALNPFTTPDAIYVSKRPQDMRAGIQRLAAVKAERDRLVEMVRLANQRFFGCRSEKVVPDRLSLFNDVEAAAEAAKMADDPIIDIDPSAFSEDGK